MIHSRKLQVEFKYWRKILRRLTLEDFNPSDGFFGRRKHDHVTPDEEPKVPEVPDDVPRAVELILKPLFALAGVADLGDVTAVKQNPRPRQEVGAPTTCDASRMQ